MRVQSIALTNFRNYASQELDLSPGAIHLFLGPNGAGKTNLLEAISVLSLTKSCLPREEEDLRQWGTEFYRVRATVRSDGAEEGTLEVVSQVLPRKQKGCFVNDVRVPAGEMLGRLPVVLFLPQDLTLFTGSPAERRAFLDRILSQTLGGYYDRLLQYQRVLKQRNALLKAIAIGNGRGDDLAPWDLELATEGSRLIIARLELMETFGLTLLEEVHALGEEWADVRMVYERSGTERDAILLAEELRQLLAQARPRDLLLQSTSVGPHRDDWHMMVDDHHLETTASRGQQRIAVLALLFLEASYLELRRGEKPVILLDDIFSELDPQHRQAVLESFTNHQVLLTAVDLPAGMEDMNVWEVCAGNILRSCTIAA